MVLSKNKLQEALQMTVTIYMIFEWALYLGLVYALIAFFAFIGIPVIKAERRPIQIAYVKVVKIITKVKSIGADIVFEFPDGSEKDFRFPSVDLYDDFQVNDMGMLTYKECKNSKNHYYRVFVSFEKGGSANG
jgi:hypothetical protein